MVRKPFDSIVAYARDFSYELAVRNLILVRFVLIHGYNM